jgi:hypothetical protein
MDFRFSKPVTFEAAADKLLQAVHAAPSVWTESRYFAFSMVVVSMTMGRKHDAKPN